jgi:histidine ammonia-lyase
VTAGLKLRQVLENVERILSIELMAAAQGIDFRRQVIGADAALGQGTGPVYDLIRQQVPFVAADTLLQPYMETVYNLLINGAVDSAGGYA